MLRAVVFDLDDTLYSERDYAISGFRAVASWAAGHFGTAAGLTHAEFVAIFDGDGRYDTFDRWLACSTCIGRTSRRSHPIPRPRGSSTGWARTSGSAC